MAGRHLRYHVISSIGDVGDSHMIFTKVCHDVRVVLLVMVVHIFELDAGIDRK